MNTYSRIQQARTEMLKSLIGDESIKSFAGRYNIDASYVSQVLTGHRAIGDKSALSLENAIGLPELSLFFPSSLQTPPEQEHDPGQQTERSTGIERNACWERLNNAINGLLESTPANMANAAAELTAARDAYQAHTKKRADA